jgi:hypothetical protein
VPRVFGVPIIALVRGHEELKEHKDKPGGRIPATIENV